MLLTVPGDSPEGDHLRHRLLKGVCAAEAATGVSTFCVEFQVGKTSKVLTYIP
jgi:hypothetical protein